MIKHSDPYIKLGPLKIYLQHFRANDFFNVDIFSVYFTTIFKYFFCMYLCEYAIIMNIESLI